MKVYLLTNYTLPFSSIPASLLLPPLSPSSLSFLPCTSPSLPRYDMTDSSTSEDSGLVVTEREMFRDPPLDRFKYLRI